MDGIRNPKGFDFHSKKWRVSSEMIFLSDYCLILKVLKDIS